MPLSADLSSKSSVAPSDEPIFKLNGGSADVTSKVPLFAKYSSVLNMPQSAEESSESSVAPSDAPSSKLNRRSIFFYT